MAEKQEKNQALEEKTTFNIDKEKDFSNWFSEILKTAELADLRYNIKGFLVYQPWSVLCMEEMARLFEKALQRKGHKPYWFPVMIPEKNFHLEKEHVEGFAPEVFWVTETGDGSKLEEKFALRPTSETAFYQMFSLWIRSYKDLPFKTYQRANVFRYETRATRPFLRIREIHWIEGHCAFKSLEDSMKQVHEDMETTQELLHDAFGIPHIFFQRPQWDKFAGAVNTYAADALMPDGRMLQLPSTHCLGQNFSKPFNVKFVDENSKEQFAYLTCYGPAFDRIFAACIITHGDNKGLRFPFEISPLQVVIVPINFEKESKVLKKALELKERLLELNYRVEIDGSEKRPGEKFYFWEMKGVPLRIEIGPKELKAKELLVFRRDLEKKEKVKEKSLLEFVEKKGKEITKNLRETADKKFKDIILDAKTVEEAKKLLGEKKIVRASFCSTGLESAKCAEAIEKDLGAKVRGTRVDLKEKPFSNCLVCGKAAKEVVYIAFEY